MTAPNVCPACASGNCGACTRALAPCDCAKHAVYGMCLACRAIEVELVNGQSGTRDFSSIGEHHAYPVGYGCEVCS